MDNNRFTGKIPIELYTQLPTLAAVDLSNNDLSGAVTEEILAIATNGSLAFFNVRGTFANDIHLLIFANFFFLFR